MSITGQNGFSGSIKVTLNGVPSGVITNPASPFSVVAGANTVVIFGAGANASTGNFTVSAQGISGSLSHSANLALTVQAASGPALPRTAYVRTDSLASLDNPAGEPRHRRILYDAVNQHVLVANRAMNRVEVFSIRGSGFQAATTVTIGGKSASVTFRDMNTLSVVTPTLSIGPQQIVVTNPDGETVALDAAFAVN